MEFRRSLTLDPTIHYPPTRPTPDGRQHSHPSTLSDAKQTKLHPSKAGAENASLMLIGNATAVLKWEGIRLMTDPNFLNAGDHVHLGPDFTADIVKGPARTLDEPPAIDVVLLSHYHEDHIDRLVEDRLRRSLPIITTSRAKEQLTTKNRDEEDFTEVYDLDTFNSMMIHITPYKTTSEVLSHRTPAIQVTATPGKHIPSGRIETANDFTGAVPPVNGWILELGYFPSLEVHSSVDAGLFFKCGYRIYISNDTLPISELSKIPELYTDADRPIDLLLVHLGGTTIPRQGLPLLMVTMDAGMGVELMRLVRPDVTIPLHFDDHNVMSEGGGMAAFEKEVEEAGLGNRVVWLERGEEVRFRVR